MEDFSSVLFHKHRPAYKQHTCQLINNLINCNKNCDGRLKHNSLPQARTYLQAEYQSINQLLYSL